MYIQFHYVAAVNPFQTQFIIKEDRDINFHGRSSLIFKENLSLNPLHIRNTFVGKSNVSHENKRTKLHFLRYGFMLSIQVTFFDAAVYSNILY